MTTNPIIISILICLFFQILLVYVMSKISEIFELRGKIINLIVQDSLKKILLFYLNFVILYLILSFVFFSMKGINGVQIVNFFFSFILIFEVCLRISDSKKFLNWIGPNLDSSLRLFVMFVICLNGTYFFTRLTHQILTSHI